MKKKQKLVNDIGSGLDMKSVIHQHSLFFDRLIELIPARFYLPNDDKERPWFQGLSMAEKASAKQESKENIKKSRRDRLDPEKSCTTTLDLLKQSLENEKANADASNSEGGDVEVEINPMVAGIEDDDRSVTYEELRHRLHRRIEELRGNRNTRNSGNESKRIEKRNEKSKKREIQRKKRKRDTGSEEDKKAKDGKSMAKAEKDASEAVKELAFSHVKLGNGEEEHGKKKKRKLSKMKELEKAKKLEEAKRDPERGEIISKKHSWKAATSRAAGIKIHDDPKLLKQSIQKEKKKHHKNAEKWKDRIGTREKMKAEKQQTRSGNIADRIHQKKMRRIAKREKKLMRPGFEGRKEGYINEN